MGIKRLNMIPLTKNEIVSEINDNEELYVSIFPINLKLIYQYQRKYPSLKSKYKIGV